MVRRASFDPFAEERRQWPHRIYVTNQFSKVVSERKVPAGADLRAEFYAELVRLAREGWALEEPYKGVCFMRRGTDRWYVSISHDRE
jgi:hypothetical protein